jgi:hypothetical protein
MGSLRLVECVVWPLYTELYTFTLCFDKLNLYVPFISGILKAVHGTQSYDHNRVTKDVVAFFAGDFPDLVEKLQLDLHEPPISQVNIYNVIILL